jgi:hypothetical protein
MSKTIVYIAHQLGSGPDREHNRAHAASWCAWLAEHFDIAPQAPWIVLSGEWAETPELRERGLACDMATIAVCDELFLCGPRISPGMRFEAAYALSLGKPVRDLTAYAKECPHPGQGWPDEFDINVIRGFLEVAWEARERVRIEKLLAGAQ